MTSHNSQSYKLDYNSDSDYDIASSYRSIQSLQSQPTNTTINLSNVTHNLNTLMSLRNTNDKSQITPVVKSNAYGHNSTKYRNEIPLHLINNGFTNLATFNIDEATYIINGLQNDNDVNPLILNNLKNIQNAKNVNILILGYFSPSELNYIEEYNSKADNVSSVAKIVPSVPSFEVAEFINSYAKKHNYIQNVALKVDSGMGRLGIVSPKDTSLKYSSSEHDSRKLALYLKETYPNLNFVHVLSHFSAPNTQVMHSHKQIENARDIAEAIANAYDDVTASITASQSYTNQAYDTFKVQNAKTTNRIGLSTYGYNENENIHLKPVMTITTTPIQIKTLPAGYSVGYENTFTTTKETKIALLPIGYANGLLTTLSNKAYIAVYSKSIQNLVFKAKILGRISMNITTIDVTDIPEQILNDAIYEVIGNNNPADKLVANAKTSDTTTYEVITSLGNLITNASNFGYNRNFIYE